ncbi:MAG: tRNA (adenosine(37)-N6)-threonylcarbamoyltransferase complex transferase subunit TsaD [Candidatus Staskawiczbacteria bacterium]|nr:tRNA (adenosine(37)-N6)-threonylcarbamoyltransferase complex transferase subunit TsaD [Candidatus Staskawiczbacteria bacterium]
MHILSIETSCDDTGISVLQVSETCEFEVLSNIIASQIKIGKQYGGVYPMMAKREHQKNILPTLIKALRESKLLKSQISNLKSQPNSKFKILNSILEREPELLQKIIPFLKKYKKPDIDLISVTNGPGLEPCLWVGVNFAKCLSYFWDIPIVPVNHIEGHILVNFLQTTSYKLPTKLFPAIALVVSGGHTQIILVKKIGQYKILGETRDDAAGECFDKCAKILGLGYPGGPIISKLAAKAGLSRESPAFAKLPRPMIGTKDYDFSFSGLKTAVLYKWRDMDKKNLPALLRKALQAGMCVEVQQAIVDVLFKKTIKAAKDYKVKSIILGGGVSANKELRKQFLKVSDDFEIIFPKPDLSTDNGLMIAIAGFYHKNKTVNWKKISTNGNLRIHPIK